MRDELIDNKLNNNDKRGIVLKSAMVRTTLAVTFAMMTSVMSSMVLAMVVIVKWKYFDIIEEFALGMDAFINIICLNIQFPFAVKWYKLSCKCCTRKLHEIMFET